MLYLETIMIDLIKFIRNSVEMSQQEFADELRIAFATVNRWENGKTMPPPSAQKAIYQFCVEHDIDLAGFVINTLAKQKEELEKFNPNMEIFFHGSKSGIEGDISPRSRAQCDFGKGFYMGTEVLQPLTLICNYEKPILYFAAIDKTNRGIPIVSEKELNIDSIVHGKDKLSNINKFSSIEDLSENITISCISLVSSTTPGANNSFTLD